MNGHNTECQEKYNACAADRDAARADAEAGWAWAARLRNALHRGTPWWETIAAYEAALAAREVGR